MNTIKTLLILLVLVVVVATPAMAGEVKVAGYGPYQSGQGGEFTITTVDGWPNISHYAMGTTRDVPGAPGGSFQSFCIEGNETLYPETEYFGTINTFAENGGMSGQTLTEPNRDYVSVGSGWLYSQFAQGTLAGYHYAADSGRQSSAAQLQNALWWLEDEEGLLFDCNNPFMLAVRKEFGTKAAAKADGGQRYGVYAFNIWVKTATGARGEFAQTQLIYDTPDGGTTLTLLGGALMAVGALRRRLRA